jgi:hypothetical protein
MSFRAVFAPIVTAPFLIAPFTAIRAPPSLKNMYL